LHAKREGERERFIAAPRVAVRVCVVHQLFASDCGELEMKGALGATLAASAPNALAAVKGLRTGAHASHRGHIVATGWW